MRIKTEFFDGRQLHSAAPLTMQPETVYLWQADVASLEVYKNELFALLSPQECCQLEKFYFVQDKMRFLIAHAVLRVLAGRYFNMTPREVVFKTGRYGKPEFGGMLAAGDYCFNLSHSHQQVAWAFARSAAVGIDIEYMRVLPELDEITRRFFHPREQIMLRRCPPGRRYQLFFDCWTGKEAFVKATGAGLYHSLSSFFIAIDSIDKYGIAHINCANAGNDVQWQVLYFRPAAGYSGACCFACR